MILPIKLPARLVVVQRLDDLAEPSEARQPLLVVAVHRPRGQTEQDRRDVVDVVDDLLIAGDAEIALVIEKRPRQPGPDRRELRRVEVRKRVERFTRFF
jgi:hypothetical protein